MVKTRWHNGRLLPQMAELHYYCKLSHRGLLVVRDYLHLWQSVSGRLWTCSET